MVNARSSYREEVEQINCGFPRTTEKVFQAAGISDHVWSLEEIALLAS
jgi:hypothetical protein